MYWLVTQVVPVSSPPQSEPYAPQASVGEQLSKQ